MRRGRYFPIPMGPSHVSTALIHACHSACRPAFHSACRPACENACRHASKDACDSASTSLA
ncbi:conserved hypothetical protein (plasmid) [Rhodococcus jostii RHA1]|uniref:Uncharacterized protein n=1 Tax=Rhodococcus jostii (strain RHA1) TaxID=101510 RepID=Q0RWQ3_RHOJR|nr:conserved hypothetical protein [Rhodococcus jostii RHA1]